MCRGTGQHVQSKAGLSLFLLGGGLTHHTQALGQKSIQPRDLTVSADVLSRGPQGLLQQHFPAVKTSTREAFFVH